MVHDMSFGFMQKFGLLVKYLFMRVLVDLVTRVGILTRGRMEWVIRVLMREFALCPLGHDTRSRLMSPAK